MFELAFKKDAYLDEKSLSMEDAINSEIAQMIIYQLVENGLMTKVSRPSTELSIHSEHCWDAREYILQLYEKSVGTGSSFDALKFYIRVESVILVYKEVVDKL